MSKHLGQRPAWRGHRRPGRGVTLVELLVAITISLVFMGSVVAAFVQISRAADDAEAQIQAHRRARTAVDMIVRDLRGVRSDPSINQQYFLLTSQPMSYGNRIDEDGDGFLDEEVTDGFDNDSDWDFGDDNHADLGVDRERADFVGYADLGDFKVDEDVLFSRDTVSFRIPADPGLGSGPRQITYRIGEFEGMDFVLLREVITNPGTFAAQTTIEPVVFDVVSLDILAWNANDDAVSPSPEQRPYWRETYNAVDYQVPDRRPIGAPFGVPPFDFPAALWVQVTVNAERSRLSDIPGWPDGERALRTETLSTVVVIDQVIRDVRYQRYIRPEN